MEERRSQLQFLRSDELAAPPVRVAVWQSSRRPRRGRALVASTSEPHGAYEASYSIQNGYPDREIVLP
jgi:hypothetical protein